LSPNNALPDAAQILQSVVAAPRDAPAAHAAAHQAVDR
jgi:hypothetical protein